MYYFVFDGDNHVFRGKSELFHYVWQRRLRQGREVPSYSTSCNDLLESLEYDGCRVAVGKKHSKGYWLDNGGGQVL